MVNMARYYINLQYRKVDYQGNSTPYEIEVKINPDGVKKLLDELMYENKMVILENYQIIKRFNIKRNIPTHETIYTSE
jgi:hypothetical protein